MGRGSGEKNSIDEPIQRTQAGCGKSIVIREPIVASGGKVQVPTTVGNGIEWDEGAVARYRVE